MFRHRIPDRIADLIRDIERLDEDAECEEDWREIREIEREVERFFLWWREHHHHHPPPPPPQQVATSLTLTIKEGDNEMASFTIDTTDGSANLQFTDRVGDPTAGPNDSVTGAPIVPVIVSDNEAVETVGTVVAGATPGSFSAPLTEVAVGDANISVAALVNSDGSAVNGPDGNAFALPDPVAVNVAAGAASELTLTVTG